MYEIIYNGEVGDVNRYLLRNGYSVKNIREYKGAYIIEVF